MGQAPLSKETIIFEIQRCAEENGGIAVGRTRFTTLTGIRESDWWGRYWATWSDAIREAGFAPNQLQGRYGDDLLLGALATLARDLGHYPTEPEVRMRRRADPDFPSHGTFIHLGRSAERLQRLREYCASSPTYSDVLALLSTSQPLVPEIVEETEVAPNPRQVGMVYLLRVGKHYKIGRSLDFGRRSREINLQLPERPERIHVIRTDDPIGIERYWHERFADRRLNGEWFLLTKSDVAAFKRWKSI